jgi:hypothetical protein
MLNSKQVAARVRKDFNRGFSAGKGRVKNFFLTFL